MSEAAVPRGLGPVAGSLRLLSDEHLMRRATAGDERAFAAIYRRYHQDLYRFCLAIIGDPQDAQDALQNAMVKVMRALPGERREIQLKPWLYRIAHNESIEVMRRRAPTAQLDSELAGTAAGPAEAAEQRARLRRLVADLVQLPDRQRGVLVMRELSGLGFEEIGAALGTSPAVARQTLYEARLSLRQMEEGRELSCDAVTKALSDADGRVTRRRDIRAHLRECAGCREFRDELHSRRRDFASLAPLPAAAAASLLQGIFGAGGAGGGGVAVGAAGSAAAGKVLGGAALGTSAAVKSAATVAVVAAIGVGAADRGGLVDVGLSGGGSKESPAAVEQDGGSPAGVKDGGSAANSATGEGPSEEPGRDGAKAEGSDRPAVPVSDVDRGAHDANGGVPPSSAPFAAQANGRGVAAHGNPAAAAHGKETAASHKGGAGAKGDPTGGSQGKGSGGTKGASGGKGGRGGSQGSAAGAVKGQVTKPAKPEHPAKPEQSSSAVSPAVPESAGGGKPAPPSAPHAGQVGGPPGHSASAYSG